MTIYRSGVLLITEKKGNSEKTNRQIYDNQGKIINKEIDIHQ